MATERGLEILKAIVHDYVRSGEPVGSQGLVERHDFNVSAATIRNDMAVLEEEELISAPHTSAGRVPTEKGYRLFVDSLRRVGRLSAPQRRAVEQFLHPDADDPEQMLVKSVRILAQLTRQLAVLQYPTMGHARIRHIDVVDLDGGRLLIVLIADTGRVDQHAVVLPPELDATWVAGQIGSLREAVNSVLVGTRVDTFAEHEDALRSAVAPQLAPLMEPVIAALRVQAQDARRDRLVVAGTSNLLRTEDDFVHSVVPVLDAIEEQVAVLRLLGGMQEAGPRITVSIGRENEPSGLGEASVVSGGYRAGGADAGRLGIVGPTRMDYSRNMTAVAAVAGYLSKLLS